MSTAVAQRPKFGAFMSNDGVQKLIRNTLTDPRRAQTFCASIISAVSLNNDLKECDFDTILSGALLGESLGLSPSPQLGQYYLVPFNDKKRGRVAVFVLGYKGYVQLAIRSGQYRNIVAKPIKKGELVRCDDFNEEYEFCPIEDPITREAAETMGYYAMLEYSNGFKKSMYWSKGKVVAHATRYSAAFGEAPAKGNFPGRVSYDDYLAGKYKKGDEWAYSSFWYKDFDAMAIKTMLRQIISHWGLLSIELRGALEADNAIIKKDDLTPEYSLDDIPDLLDEEVYEADDTVDANAETGEQATLNMADLQ